MRAFAGPVLAVAIFASGCAVPRDAAETSVGWVAYVAAGLGSGEACRALESRRAGLGPWEEGVFDRDAIVLEDGSVWFRHPARGAFCVLSRALEESRLRAASDPGGGWR